MGVLLTKGKFDMKRFLVSLSMVFVMITLVLACGTSGKVRQNMTPGIYVTTSTTVIFDGTTGINQGGEMKVETVISSGRIESITVLEHNDSPNFADTARF